MARKKYSEMTIVELADRLLKGRTWEEAEEVGVEILARCMAKRVYAEGKGINYMTDLLNRICTHADEWAEKHSFELACAKGGYEQKQKEKDNKNENK